MAFEIPTINLTYLLIHLIVNIIIISPSLWIAGRLLVGGQKAKFTDAIWIVTLGTIIGTIVGLFTFSWVSLIIQLIVWLALVKHFFDCGWLKALLISIVAIIVFIIIVAILAFIGIAIFSFL